MTPATPNWKIPLTPPPVAAGDRMVVVACGCIGHLLFFVDLVVGWLGMLTFLVHMVDATSPMGWVFFLKTFGQMAISSFLKKIYVFCHVNKTT